MTGSPNPNQPKGTEFMALVALVGMGLLLALLGIIHPPGLRVPPAIAYLLAFVLLMAAASLASRLAGKARANALFASLVLFGFAATGAWIAFDRGGAQSCVRRLGTDENVARAVAVSPTTCRVVFGTGAVVSLAMACGAVLLARRRSVG